MRGLARLVKPGSGLIRLHWPWSTPTVYLLCIETLSPKTSLSGLTGNPPISLILELLFPQKTPRNSQSPDGLSEHQAICRPNNKLANPLMLALMSILLESRGLALRILGEPSCGDEQPLICDARQRMLIPSPKLASSKITGLFSGSLLSFLQHARQCEQVEENKPGKFG